MTFSLGKRNGSHDQIPITDPLGIFFMTFAAFYTGGVFLGLLLLFFLRKTYAIRLRGFWTICSSILFLHVYLVLCLLAYPFQKAFPCDVQYWVMGIFFPFGIAMFQVANIRLLSYYEGQLELSDAGFLQGKKKKYPFSKRSVVGRWRCFTTVQKTYVCIAVGMVIQAFVTFLLYFGSRRFHASYGFFSEYIDSVACLRGVEWVPTTLWQCLWVFVFGPWVLLKIRKIKDGHHWAWQTRLAIVSCLPGTPLWLLFLYSDSKNLAQVSQYFVPPGWFLPGMFAMEIINICFPLYDAISERQTKNVILVADITRQGQLNEGLSMGGLEQQLSRNIDPLIQWAAETDLTAENIVFLREVRDYKLRWVNIATLGILGEEMLRERFEEAALIYFALVNPLTARFNINIDYRTYHDLERMFDGVRYTPFEDETSSKSSKSASSNSDIVITPWEEFDAPPSPTTTEKTEVTLVGGKPSPRSISDVKVGEGNSKSLADSRQIKIPADFTINLFDKAYNTVKQDVFLNTWQKFEARASLRPSVSSGSSGESSGFRSIKAKTRSATASVWFCISGGRK